jgi:hypothetical protein
MEWISVTERLPETKGWYFVWVNNGVDVNTCNKCYYGGERFSDIMGFPPVTHWMPLPEPPNN